VKPRSKYLSKLEQLHWLHWSAGTNVLKRWRNIEHTYSELS